MTTTEAREQIKSIVGGRFGKYAKNFLIEITEMSKLQTEPMWKFDFSYESFVDGSVQSVSDEIEVGNLNGIVERVWLPLLAIAENSNDKFAPNVRKELVRTGESLGFVDPNLSVR